MALEENMNKQDIKEIYERIRLIIELNGFNMCDVDSPKWVKFRSEDIDNELWGICEKIEKVYSPTQ